MLRVLLDQLCEHGLWLDRERQAVAVFFVAEERRFLTHCHYVREREREKGEIYIYISLFGGEGGWEAGLKNEGRTVAL